MRTPPPGRRLIRQLVPRVICRVHALLRLALDDLSGPDPESALWHLRNAKRALEALLKTLPPT